MTTNTSNHGARQQKDERLRPTQILGQRSRGTVSPVASNVALKRSTTPNDRPKSTPLAKRNSTIPIQFRSRIEPISKAPPLSGKSTSAPNPTRVKEKKRRPRHAQANSKTSAKQNKTGLYQNFATPFGYLVGSAALLVGWFYRESRDLNAESGLGYFLGIVAVFCMLTLLIYPIRKRFRFLRFIGSVKNWFRTHMMLGALGPIAALYHCNFQLGSLNSQVALYSALLVAGSGLIGRVLYQKMNQNLYGSKTDFNQLRKSLQANTPKLGNSLTFLPLVASRIGAFDQRILVAGKRLWPSMKILPGLKGRARREKDVLLSFTEQQLSKTAQNCPVIDQHQHRLSAVLDRYLFLHMAQARRLARLQLYERLFALWHLVHLPFFFMLVISTAVHVLAVHLY